MASRCWASAASISLGETLQVILDRGGALVGLVEAAGDFAQCPLDARKPLIDHGIGAARLELCDIVFQARDGVGSVGIALRCFGVSSLRTSRLATAWTIAS